MRKIRAKALRQLAQQIYKPGVPGGVRRIYRFLKRVHNHKYANQF